MKIKHLLPLAALAFPALLAARPADPDRVIKMQNPDGTVVEVRNNGDERFSYYTLADGETIVERNKQGYWAPAIRNGQKLLSSRLADINALRSENKPFDFTPYVAPSTRMAPIDDVDGRTKFPTLAEDVHALVVLIEFSDTPFSVPNPKEAFEKMLNEEGYSEYGSCGSARDYFVASSNGKFRPTFDVSDVVKVSNTSAYYVAAGTSFNGAGRTGRFGEALREALLKLDEQGLDFSKYDYDNDGDIDNIFFFYSGYGQADSHDPTTIWPHQADYIRYVLDYEGSLKLPAVYLDGKRFGPYACSNELNGSIPPGAVQPYLDGIGAFCHEFGHVLGIPDFYDAQGGNTKSPGRFSIMANGSYNGYSTRPPLFSSYEQWVCHWADFDEQTEEGAELELSPLAQGGKGARIPVRFNRPTVTVYYDDEYFILESRDDTGWDKDLPEHGMLIWHVRFDHETWINNLVNCNNYPRVQLLYNKIATNPTVAWGNDPALNYVEPSMKNALIPTKPVITSGTFKYGNYLTDIKYDAATGKTTLRYNLDKELNDEVTTMNTPTRDLNDKQEFTLSWEPVEGAEGYYLTCAFVSPSGQTSYLEDMNDKFIAGGKTHYTFTNFFPSFWNRELVAKVRVKMRYPSSNYSEEIKFIPANLTPAGIDDVIGAETPEIYGAQGMIVAPEGAEVYNLQGVRTGTTDLPAGIYIVRSGRHTAKVVVK